MLLNCCPVVFNLKRAVTWLLFSLCPVYITFCIHLRVLNLICLNAFVLIFIFYVLYIYMYLPWCFLLSLLLIKCYLCIFANIKKSLKVNWFSIHDTSSNLSAKEGFFLTHQFWTSDVSPQQLKIWIISVEEWTRETNKSDINTKADSPSCTNPI